MLDDLELRCGDGREFLGLHAVGAGEDQHDQRVDGLF